MGLDRRVVVALSVIALILAPAAALRAVCAGHSCDEPDEGGADVPFCSLPEDRRSAIVAGFREGRSPDILTVTGTEPDGRVPLFFAGTGVRTGAPVSNDATLDDVAPTIAEIIGLERPHPEVRSGTAIPGVAEGNAPDLVVVAVVEGLGVAEFTDGPWRRMRDAAGMGTTTDAGVGSQPNDPAAVLTTIGTGGLPRQHGITGRLLRNDTGKLVEAWGPQAPVSVIATLADDMDESLGQDPLIGMIATDPSDRGLIGENWYVDTDKDLFRIARSPERAADEVSAAIEAGFGDDDVPDLLGVVLSGPAGEVDRALGRITAPLRMDPAPSMAVVMTGTGSPPPDNGDVIGDLEGSIAGSKRLIEGAVPGGFFVDQRALASTGTTEDEVIDAVADTGAFTDAFAAITVSFARYC